MSAEPTPEDLSAAALWQSFPLFFTALVDPFGKPLATPAHLMLWTDLVAEERRLILRAPRSHGKTTLLLAYIAWCCWRHGRDASGRLIDGAPGPFEIMLFSATLEQVSEHMVRLRDLLEANSRLFAPLLPEAGAGTRQRASWSATRVRLRNGATVGARSFHSSLRGMHPDVLLLDDVLNDANTGTLLQRQKTLDIFMGTILPMAPARLVIIGTAIHQTDLLAHLGRGTGKQPDPLHTPLGFRFETFRALDEETDESLWPERFPPDTLHAIRDADPVSFSREYQNDPRDDASSLFPFDLTQRALVAGADLILGTGHPAGDREVVVLGIDPARSAAAGADFTAMIVVAYDVDTGTRRVLDMRREKGLEFDAQIELIRDLVVQHRVSVAKVEDNGMQQWLIDALMRLPQTREVISGHKTFSSNKADLQDGIPRLSRAFHGGRWIIPSGDVPSLRLARRFQAELGAYGFLNGRYAGVGEHDDTVMAAWLVERAILHVEWFLANQEPEYITIKDLGIEPVIIGPDF